VCLQQDADFLRVAKTNADGYRSGMPVSAFGQNVKRLRLARKPPLNAIELARLMQTDPSVISRWENGKGGLPETPTLMRLAKVLDAMVDDLLVHVDPAYDAIRNRILPNRDHADAEPRADLTHENDGQSVTPAVTRAAQDRHLHDPSSAGGTRDATDSAGGTTHDHLPQSEAALNVEMRTFNQLEKLAGLIRVTIYLPNQTHKA
jgi:transcriptional regulator with XRE-family HTH domain